MQGNKIKKSKIIIMKVYFPTTDHTVEEVGKMYEDITVLINMTSKRSNM